MSRRDRGPEEVEDESVVPAGSSEPSLPDPSGTNDVTGAPGAPGEPDPVAGSDASPSTAPGAVDEPPALTEFLVDESILDTDPAPGDLNDLEGAASVAAADQMAEMAEEIDSIETEALDALNAVMKERDEYLDTLRRLQADFENYKKRMLKQQAEASDRATERFVQRLLPVLDTVDLARAHGGSEGVEQIGGPLLDLLGKEGLERIDPKGEPFDPNEHDAVLHEEGEGGPTVAEVLRSGWRWKGRVLRAAMVKVAG